MACIAFWGDEKTKFRTRLEKGSQANSTEIFISHRNREGLIQKPWKQLLVQEKGHMILVQLISIPEYKSDDEKKEPVLTWRFRVNRS